MGLMLRNHEKFSVAAHRGRAISSPDREAIHSVLIPIGRISRAPHVHGVDFFDPPVARSQWDHETLDEAPRDVERVEALFREFRAVSRQPCPR